MVRSPRRRCGARSLIAALLAATAGLAAPGVGLTAPPPPGNPSDHQIDSGRADAQSTAGQVGQLANQLAEAESRLIGLTSRVELKMEDANKARVDLARAERARSTAQQFAKTAAAEASAASLKIEEQQRRLDQFVASSYRQGSLVGSLTAFVGANDPQEVLDRAEMLDAVSASQRNILGELERARTEKANKDSHARQALRSAENSRAAADAARGQAEAAKNTALQAQASQARQAQLLEADKARVEQDLARARASVRGLESQRDRYLEWLEIQYEEEQAVEVAALSQNAPAVQSGEESAAPESEPAGSSVEVAVQRALSQLGVPYAWGGGNAHGPTRGIRDGGVADAHGDYRKIGFDCSGLMIYAFAGAGVALDHYSGYQYQAGQKVPLSQKERGDMLFWQEDGSTRHVALYLGNGQMVEAPYSGSRVRVTPVRYNGIAPYAVRVL